MCSRVCIGACVTANFESFLLVYSVTSLTAVPPAPLPAMAELGNTAASLQDDFNPLLSGERTLPLTRV